MKVAFLECNVHCIRYILYKRTLTRSEAISFRIFGTSGVENSMDFAMALADKPLPFNSITPLLSKNLAEKLFIPHAESEKFKMDRSGFD
jgi:hypothetical protein